MIAKALVEQPLVVADARAVAAKAQRRDGIEEARRQPSQSAVAQRRLVFLLLDLLERDAPAREQRLRLVKPAEVDQVVAQQLADEELRT